MKSEKMCWSARYACNKSRDKPINLQKEEFLLNQHNRHHHHKSQNHPCHCISAYLITQICCYVKLGILHNSPPYYDSNKKDVIMAMARQTCLLVSLAKLVDQKHAQSWNCKTSLGLRNVD